MGSTTTRAEAATKTNTAVTTTTNLGPLTTVFTPPSSCTSLIYGYSRGGNYTNNLGHTSIGQFNRGAICGTAFDIRYGANPDCMPSDYGAAYDSVLEHVATTELWPVYSPGMQCPAGYMSAYAVSKPLHSPVTPSSWDKGSEFRSMLFVNLQPGEAAYACCPRYMPQSPYLCSSSAPAGAFLVDRSSLCGTDKHITSLSTDTRALDFILVMDAVAVILIQTWQTPETTKLTSNDVPFLPEVTTSRTGKGKSAAASLHHNQNSIMFYFSLVMTLLSLLS